jgi:hypothetical protein
MASGWLSATRSSVCKYVRKMDKHIRMGIELDRHFSSDRTLDGVMGIVQTSLVKLAFVGEILIIYSLWQCLHV